MGSKQVLDDGKLAATLVQAARTNAAEVARKRAAQYAAAGLKGAPTAEALAAVIEADAALLDVRRGALRDADKALADELGDDAAVFAARDAGAAAVRAILVEFRDLVQTNCGALAVREAGFVGETTRDPVALEELGRGVVDHVAKRPPKSTKKAVRFDAAAGIEGLAHAVAALAKANADVLREKREEQASRAARDKAWATFDREYASSASTLDGRLRAVSLDDVADRVTPSARTTAATDAAVAPAPDGPKPG